MWGATFSGHNAAKFIIFQSTRPVWGATYAKLVNYLADNFISIHAPRVGRDRDRLCNKMSDIAISIHAPRVGRDVEHD